MADPFPGSMAVTPPREGDRALRVVGVVLIVGIAAVAAIFVYVLVARPVGPAGPAPSFDFGPPSYGNPGDATLNLSYASREADLSYFRADFFDLTAVPSVQMFSVAVRAGTLFSSGPTVVTFEDVATVGKLGRGDTFRFMNLTTSRTYSLVLVYVPANRTSGSATIAL